MRMQPSLIREFFNRLTPTVVLSALVTLPFSANSNEVPSGPPDMIPPPPPQIAPPPPPPSLPPERLIAPGTRRPQQPPPEAITAPEEPELMRMEMFLQMDTKKLARMRRLIESIEQMNDEEKEKLLGRVREMRAVSRERRQEFLDNFKDLDRRERRILVRTYYRSTPEERQAILEDLKGIDDAAERETYFSKLDEKHPGWQRPAPSPVEKKPEMRAPGEVRPAPPPR